MTVKARTKEMISTNMNSDSLLLRFMGANLLLPCASLAWKSCPALLREARPFLARSSRNVAAFNGRNFLGMVRTYPLEIVPPIARRVLSVTVFSISAVTPIVPDPKTYHSVSKALNAIQTGRKISGKLDSRSDSNPGG
jgi:hypothetical protein